MTMMVKMATTTILATMTIGARIQAPTSFKWAQAGTMIAHPDRATWMETTRTADVMQLQWA